MKEIIKRSVIFLRMLMYHAIHLFSYLIPKRKGLWIFVGWRRNQEREIFAENTKYFFLHAHNSLSPGVRPIWIGADEKISKLLQENGFESYPINSIRGIFYSLVAEYVFISGFLQLKNWKFSGGSKIIQLWHGKSLKKTGFESPYAFSRYTKFYEPNLFTPPDKFVAISEFLSDFIVTDFRIPKQKILVTGIPKYDALLKPEAGYEIDVDKEIDKQIERIRTSKPRRIIFYGPTFRPDGGDPIEIINLKKLDEVLKKNNDHLIISLHPKFSTKDWIPEDVSLSNIHFSQGDMDKYPIMHKFDLLITDYSSLAIDFLFMNKPVIFFAYDIKKYQDEMGIYEEIWDAVPNSKVFSFGELLDILDKDMSDYQKEIAESRETIFSYTDSGASRRIAESIISLPL